MNSVLRELLVEMEAEHSALGAEITAVREILDQDALSAEFPPDRPDEEPPVKPVKLWVPLPRAGSVTPEMVRDAIVHMWRHPPLDREALHIRPEHFLAKHLADWIGCHPDNVKLRQYVDEAERKGILVSAPWRNGRQFRYQRPEPGRLVGAGHAEIEAKLGRSDAVPGTGGHQVRTGSKDLNDMLSRLPRDRFAVERSARHVKVTNRETRGFVMMASTPSEYRGLLNARAQLRGIGANV